MPEFVLDLGSPEHARNFRALDDFTRGYVETAFFCGIEDPEDDTGNTDADVGFADLHPETLNHMVADCVTFQRDAAALLAEAYERPGYEPQQAGRDFWYTRNGHGVGFWDRKPLEAGDLGRRLSALCGWGTTFPVVDLYVGDDGRVYA